MRSATSQCVTEKKRRVGTRLADLTDLTSSATGAAVATAAAGGAGVVEDTQSLFTSTTTEAFYDVTPTVLMCPKSCNPLDGRRKTTERSLLAKIPNEHKKLPDVKQRTPNVTADNLVLYKNKQDGGVWAVLGFFDKKVRVDSGPEQVLRGWVMSGGHMEYHKDLSVQECAYRELAEEFGLKPEDIVKTVVGGVVDDQLRDERNQYLTTVFVHWVNQEPSATAEHATLVKVPIATLIQVAQGKKTITGPDRKAYGLIHGHDNIINTILGLAAVKDLVADILYCALSPIDLGRA